LGKLERRFPDELVVIGVHSAKFPAERPGGSLRSAIQRYEVEHPVINDRDFDIWSQYGVRAWPTLMFVDPAGYVIGKHEGEAPAEALIEAAERLLKSYDEAGVIDRTPIPGIRREPRPLTTLSFPGKVLASSEPDRLIISDTGHHRLLVCSLDGQNCRTIGTGEPGFADGSASEARFNHPQGLALDGDTLYVADTRNAAIRRVDLASDEVTTVAGTGEPGMGMPSAGPAHDVELRSPWDLALHDGWLYIAMAGTHQLWVLDLERERVEPFAGNGVEAIRDGLRAVAWLAQPSGLVAADGRLYFADSETSAIRFAELPPEDGVHTLVGTGLFDFGDVDGVGDDARLQHPIGLDVAGGVVYVADSYNHKIKRLYPGERRVESWLGSGEMGLQDGIGSDASFDEPSGISIAGGRAYIADTNNHAIRVAELETGLVSTLTLELLEG
jgi:DNA-binding beta-propeller fold protein YncE